MIKSTMQDIADALNVSRVTVWKVFNNKPGVSDPLCNQIMAKAAELNYLKPDRWAKETNSVIDSHQITVSIIVSRPESSVFWSNIIHLIAKEFSTSNINLMYTYLPSEVPNNYTLPANLTNGTVQGIVVFNVYDTKLLGMLNILSIPKVFLDTVTSIPFDTINGDLFLLEGKSSIAKITDYIIKSGRTNIGFIGDIQYARTNYERYDGFLSSMKKNGLTTDYKLCFTDKIGISTYQKQIEDFLRGLPKLPEAFVCVSDYVAYYLLQYLTENNYKVPDDIAVSGYDGNTEYLGKDNNLTTVKVQIDTLSKRLAKQLLYRIENPTSSFEVTYIYSEVEFGKTTEI